MGWVEGVDTSNVPAASVLELAREYADDALTPTGMGFAQWLRSVRAGDGSSDEDVVDLATFHAAKGLEWPHVTIVGFEEGLAPMDGSGEEARLVYVAITRAVRSLHLSWAHRRDGERRRPSRWLAEIEAIGAPPVPPTADQLRQHLAAARRAADHDDARHRRDALEAWRAAAACVGRAGASSGGDDPGRRVGYFRGRWSILLAVVMASTSSKATSRRGRRWSRASFRRRSKARSHSWSIAGCGVCSSSWKATDAESSSQA